MPLVSSCHASPGAAAVCDVYEVAVVGWLGDNEVGNVLRLNAPKCKSCATKCPLMVLPTLNFLQSPPLSMWISTVGAVLSSWIKYWGVVAETTSEVFASSNQTYH